METDTLFEQLLRSPKLVLYYQRVQAVLEEERKRRQLFYEQIRERDKAEFINGEILFHSPVQLKHNEVSGLLLVLLRTFVDRYDLGYVGYEKILISLTRNDYEPDICFFSKSKSVQFSPDQVRFPVPDFIVEVLSPGTEQIDRGIKFMDYASHGVGEYWLIDPEIQIVEQYILREDQYVLRIKSDTGELKSIVIPDFKIPIRAIFDRAENLRALQKILE